LARAEDPASALRDLVASYAGFALAHPHLVDVLITEVRNLPPDAASALAQAQHDYDDEWVHLLRQLHPDLDSPRARVAVHAAHMLSNDLARTPGIRSRSQAASALTVLGRRLLAV